MRRYLLLGMGLLLTTSAARAQRGSMGGGVVQPANVAPSVVYPSMTRPGAPVKAQGTPYLEPRWLKGRMFMQNDAPLGDPMLLKYDVLTNSILVRTSPEKPDSGLVNTSQLVRFELEDPAGPQGPRVRSFRRFAEAPEAADRAGYVEVLHAGQYALLKQCRKRISPGVTNGIADRPDQIMTRTEYYLALPDGTAKPVKLNAKALRSAAPALGEAITQAAAQRDPRNETEWGALLDSIDSASAPPKP